MVFALYPPNLTSSLAPNPPPTDPSYMLMLVMLPIHQIHCPLGIQSLLNNNKTDYRQARYHCSLTEMFCHAVWYWTVAVAGRPSSGCMLDCSVVVFFLHPPTAVPAHSLLTDPQHKTT